MQFPANKCWLDTIAWKLEAPMPTMKHWLMIDVAAFILKFLYMCMLNGTATIDSHRVWDQKNIHHLLLVTSDCKVAFKGRWTWWHYQMESFSALLALCEANPPVTGGFPSQSPLTRSWCFLWSVPKQTVWQTTGTPVIWDAITLIMTSLYHESYTVGHRCVYRGKYTDTYSDYSHLM